jgi:hypothetical protein
LEDPPPTSFQPFFSRLPVFGETGVRIAYWIGGNEAEFDEQMRVSRARAPGCAYA